MLKKIIIISFLLISIFACGKKASVYEKKSGLIKMKVYGTSNS